MTPFYCLLLWNFLIILFSSNISYDIRGVATIDIELTNIDINQCDVEEDVVQGDVTQDEDSKNKYINQNAQAKKIVDIFRGTHSCQKTTKVYFSTSFALKT